MSQLNAKHPFEIHQFLNKIGQSKSSNPTTSTVKNTAFQIQLINKLALLVHLCSEKLFCQDQTGTN